MARDDRVTQLQRIKRFAISRGRCEVCGKEPETGNLFMTRTDIYKDHKDCELNDYRMMCSYCRARTTAKQRGQKNTEKKEKRMEYSKDFMRIVNRGEDYD